MGGLILDGIVFDADGILFDTENLGRRVWTEIGAEMGLPQPARDYLTYVGRSRADILAEMARLYGADFPGEEFMANCSKRAMAIMEAEGIPMKPGVYELLSFLKEKGVPTALATSTYRDRTNYRMGRAGLLGYFQSITTGDQVVHSKPDPEIYALACRQLGVTPARAIAVEDSRNGILSAHGAGMRVVMVPDLIPPTPDLEERLFCKFDSLLELRDYFETVL